jgi:hypothetical protein
MIAITRKVNSGVEITEVREVREDEDVFPVFPHMK